jgi:hypothetical protein
VPAPIRSGTFDGGAGRGGTGGNTVSGVVELPSLTPLPTTAERAADRKLLARLRADDFPAARAELAAYLDEARAEVVGAVTG